MITRKGFGEDNPIMESVALSFPRGHTTTTFPLGRVVLPSRVLFT
jgi:hypothetical protein